MLKKVLIVDDEAILRMALSAMIKGLGYESVEAADYDAMLDVMYLNDFDLVITDYDLNDKQGRNGLDVIRLILSSRNVPVILCSGSFLSVEGAKIALDAGAGSFLRKPYTSDELRASIKLAEGIRKLQPAL